MIVNVCLVSILTIIANCAGNAKFAVIIGRQPSEPLNKMVLGVANVGEI